VSRAARRRGNLPLSTTPAARPVGGTKPASITFDQDNPYK
jgi:hypothetical protein